MAQAQGFDLSQNLAESNTGVSDRRILENLIETGITNDFVLFANNLRSFSEVDSDAFTVDANGRCTITEPGILPFSNDTTVDVVKYENESDQENQIGAEILRTLIAFDSNGIDSFRLKDGDGNPVTNSSLFKGNLISLRRSNAVTNQNLQNIKRERLPVIKPGLEETIDTDIIDITIFDETSVTDAYENADRSISFLQSVKESVPSTLKDTILNNKDIIFDGNIRILNTSNTAIAGNPDAPGLYIIADGTPLLAFSDTSNPWTEESSDPESGASLKTLATTSTVETLQIKNENTASANGTIPEFEGDWANSASSANGSITEFTHKIPIKIDGNTTTVFLLAKE